MTQSLRQSLAAAIDPTAFDENVDAEWRETYAGNLQVMALARADEVLGVIELWGNRHDPS